MPEQISTWEMERYISQMVDIEDFIYEEIENQWTNVIKLSYKICHTNQGLYINDRLICGGQAIEIVKYILEYYQKVQNHYKNPNFKNILDPIQKHFPDRSEYQIAVVEDIHNPGELRIRKRIFRKLQDRK